MFSNLELETFLNVYYYIINSSYFHLKLNIFYLVSMFLLFKKKQKKNIILFTCVIILMSMNKINYYLIKGQYCYYNVYYKFSNYL